jgi:hypothetical protein
MSAATRPGNTESAREPDVNFQAQPLSPQSGGVCERCRSSFGHGRSRFPFGEYLFLVSVELLGRFGLLRDYPLALVVLTSLKLIPKADTSRVFMWFSIVMVFVASYRVWAKERKHNEPPG